MDNQISESDIKRFWSYVNKTANGNDCWLWTGATNKNPYGYFMTQGGSIGAHRFSYQLANGRIPFGHEIHHTCNVKCCVNPRHLQLVTPGTHPGTLGVTNKNKTHCWLGHKLTPENTYTYSNGARECRKCRRRRHREYRQRRTP